MAAGHIKLKLALQDPRNPDEAFVAELTVRTDLITMEAGRKRDAAYAITMQRVGEAFLTVYHAACAPKEGETT